MSTFNIRQTGPQVYDYTGYNNTSSYIAPGQPIQNVPATTTNVYRTSNVQPVNPTRTSNVQPVNIQPVSNVQKTSQVNKGSRTQVVSNDKRFANYHHNQYKYNLFSLIDEPWNRCLQIGKCGSCPGNQCIARQARRGLWTWN